MADELRRSAFAVGRGVHGRVHVLVAVSDVGAAMSPADTLVRQVRALALDVELSRLDGASVRAAVLTRLRDMLERYESDVEDDAAGEKSEREQREASVEW